MRKFVLLIIILVIVGGFFYYRNFLAPKDEDNIENIRQNTKIEQDNTDTGGETSQEDAQVAQEFSENAPDVLGESAEIQRFWFPKGDIDPVRSSSPKVDATSNGIDNNPIFYVEYLNNNGNQRKALVQKISEGAYEILAKFLPGRNEWELETGEDILFGQELKLYESR